MMSEQSEVIIDGHNSAAFIIYGWPWMRREQMLKLPLPTEVWKICHGDLCDWFDQYWDMPVTIFDAGDGADDQHMIYLGVEIAGVFDNEPTAAFIPDQLTAAQNSLLEWLLTIPVWLKLLLRDLAKQSPQYYLLKNEG